MGARTPLRTGRRLVLWLVLLLLALALLPGVGSAASAQEVSSCTTISSSGVYQLSANVTNGNTTTCIEVTASNVTLDGNGHVIDGVNASNASDGIRIAGTSGSRLANVTVVDVTLTGWGEGVNATYTNNTTLRRVSADNASRHAVAMTDLGGTTTLEHVSTTNGSQEADERAVVLGDSSGLAPTTLVLENITIRDAGIGLETVPTTDFETVRARHLRSTDTDRFAFKFRDGTVQVSDVVVRDMADGESGAALDVGATSGQANVTRVTVANVSGLGVNVQASQDAIARQVTVRNASVGMALLSTSSDTTTIDVDDVRVVDAGFGGIAMPEGYGVNMNNVTVRNVSRYGVGIGLGSFREMRGGAVLENVTVVGVRDGHGIDARTGRGVTGNRLRVADVEGNGLNLSTKRESPLDTSNFDDYGDTVYDSRVTNVSGVGVSMFNDGGSDVRNVTIRNAGNGGLDLETTIYTVDIEEVRVVNTGGTAIEARTDGSGAFDKGVLLTNVTVNGSAGDGIRASPPYFDGANSEIDGATVLNATVWNAGGEAVSFEGTGTTNVSDLRVGPSRVRDAPFGFDATVGGFDTVEVRPADPLVAPPPRNRSVFRFLQFRLTDTTLDNVTVEYADADAGNLDESALRGWVYDDTGWTERNGSVDTNANVVTAENVGPTSDWVTVAPLAPTTDPEPTYGNVSADKTRVVDGEPYNVSVDVTNDGGEMLDAVVVTRNGRAASTHVVQLPGSSSQTVAVTDRFHHASTTDAVFEVSTVETANSVNVTVADGDTATQPNWTSWHLMPENDNHDPGLEPPRPPLSVEWNTTYPEPNSCCSPMNPLVVNGTLYAYTYEETFAMDAETGAVLWNNTMVNGTYLGGMAYDDGRVFVSTYEGIKAVNASTGTVVWERNRGATNAPVVLNGTVYVQDDFNSSTLALDPATGATVWNYTYSNSAPGFWMSVTAVNGTVYVPMQNGTVVAHDAGTGAVEWQANTSAPERGYYEATAAVTDGTVYVADADGSGGHLHALDADTGAFRWNASAGYTFSGLAVTNDTVYTATCGDAVYAYDTDTGTLRWEANGVGCAYDVSEPVAAEGVVYATNYDNETLALDADTGEVAYRFELPGWGKGSAPVPYNGMLYFTTRYNSEPYDAVYALSGPEWPRVTPQRTDNGTTTELTVLREHRDEPITNATVVINGTTLNTDASGTVNHTFTTAGIEQVQIDAPDTANGTYVNTTRTVLVEGPAVFAVSGVNSSGPIVEGETLTVNATVENTGGSTGTQTVTLSVNGSRVDSESVTLDIDESTTVTLSWSTTSGDAGNYTATVASTNESASTSVTVESSSSTSEPTDSQTQEPTGTPAIDVDPSRVEFDRVRVNGSTVATVTVENDGSAALDVDDIALSLDSSPAFAVAGGGGSTTIAPGDTHEVTVEFAPTETGEVTGDLVVQSNASETPTVTVDVAGTGVQPNISVSPDSVDFGTVRAGTDPATETVTLTNDGRSELTLSAISVRGADAGAFEIVNGGGAGTLAPGESRTVTVAFAPKRSGNRSARLLVESDDPTLPTLGVSLTGSGIAPDIGVSPPALTYGNVTVDEAVTRTLLVRNDGRANLSVEAPTVFGPDANVFTVENGDSFTLGPGERRRLTVRFEPSSTGPKSAYLRLLTDDPDEPQVDIYLTNTRTVVRTNATSRGNQTSVNVTVTNAEAGRPVAVAVSQPETRNESAGVDSVTFTPEESGNISLTVLQRPRTPETAPEFERENETATQPASYTGIRHTIPNEDLDNVTITFRVRKDRIAALENTDPDEVALYRYENESYRELPTERIGETATHYIYEAASPGLSDFVTGIKRARFEIADAQVTLTQIRVGEGLEVITRVTNTGSADGSFVVKLQLRNEVVAERSLTIAANGTRQTTFERAFDDPGVYELFVNEVFVSNITVEGGATPADEDGGATGDADDAGAGTATGDDTGLFSPGFGPVVALLALVLGVALRVRHRSGG